LGNANSLNIAAICMVCSTAEASKYLQSREL
jgi:hypothetical protein